MSNALKFSLFIVVLVLLASSFSIAFSPRSTVDKTQEKEITDTVAITPTAIPQRYTLLFVGDIMLGRKVMITSEDNKDPFFPFKKVASVLQTADITFANLENPIVKDCPRHVSGFKFCTTYAIAEGLKFAGIDVVSLANNHTDNYGSAGMVETRQFLDRLGIDHSSDSLVIKQLGSLKVGFIGLYYVVNEPNEKDYQKVKTAKSQVDILVVSPHWGVEYTTNPTQAQTVWAKRFFDAGADIIVGHHPHWVQIHDCLASAGQGVWADGVGCESGEKRVYYSLGNFVFDQMWSEETKKGVAIKLTIEDGKIIKEEFLPTYIKDWGQPEFVN